MSRSTLKRKGRPVKVELSDKDLLAEAVHDAHVTHYPDWSRDQLLCHPDEAKGICAEVRDALHRKVTDFEILWTYLNAHKRRALGK